MPLAILPRACPILPETDDAEGFAVNLNALVCLLFPFAFAHGVTRNADEASAGEHMSHCKLCNSITGSAGECS